VPLDSDLWACEVVPPCLGTLSAATRWVMRSWSVTTLSVEVLVQHVRGSWGAERLQACLPALKRYLRSAVRDDRGHQETTARAWLERRPTSRLVIREAA